MAELTTTEMVTDEELAEMGYTGEAPAEDKAEGAETAEPETDGNQDSEPDPEAEPAELHPEGEQPADNPGKLRREDDDGEEPPKVSKRALKRAKYEIKALRREIEDLKRAQAEAKTQTTQSAQKPEPIRRDQFSSDADYVEALVKSQLDAEGKARAQADAQAKADSDAHQAEVSAWVKKIHENFKSQEERDDYDESIETAFAGDPAAHIGAMAGEYICQHPSGPKILRYLADHSKVCARLKDGHPFEQAEILRNIVSFVEKKAAPKKTERKPVAPLGSIKSGGAASKVVKSAEDLFEEMAR